ASTPGCWWTPRPSPRCSPPRTPPRAWPRSWPTVPARRPSGTGSPERLGGPVGVDDVDDHARAQLEPAVGGEAGQQVQVPVEFVDPWRGRVQDQVVGGVVAGPPAEPPQQAAQGGGHGVVVGRVAVLEAGTVGSREQQGLEGGRRRPWAD